MTEQEPLLTAADEAAYIDESTEQAVEALAGRLADALDPKLNEQFKDVSAQLGRLLDRVAQPPDQPRACCRSLEDLGRGIDELRARLSSTGGLGPEEAEALRRIDGTTGQLAQKVAAMEASTLGQLRMMNAQLLLWRKDNLLVQKACIRILELFAGIAGQPCGQDEGDATEAPGA
jgi:hypothetical protein